jgi:hypothetical protein
LAFAAHITPGTDPPDGSGSTALRISGKVGKRKGSSAKLARTLSASVVKKACGDGVTFLNLAWL